VIWRLATDAEYESFLDEPGHPLCAFSYPTVPGKLRIN